MKLADLIKQDGFESQSVEAMLNVIATASWITNELNAVMAPFGVTPAQYNVLRILRGSHPEPMACSAVGARLLNRTPDVTRLVNRLEKAGHVSRERSAGDRRVVNMQITDAGLELLERMQPAVSERQAALMRALDEDEQQKLTDLLERLRDGG